MPIEAGEVNGFRVTKYRLALTRVSRFRQLTHTPTHYAPSAHNDLFAVGGEQFPSG